MLVEILSIIGIKQSRLECSLNTTYLVNIEIACTWQRLSSWRITSKTDVGDCHNRFSPLIWGTRGRTSRWKSRREGATSLSKAVTARRKRQWPVQNAVGVTGLLHGNQSKAQTIQVAGFHRRLASPNLSLPSLSFSSPFFLTFIRSSFFSLALHRFPSSPTFSLLAERIFLLHRFCFFSSLPYCIQSGSTKLETVALSALLRLLLSADPVSPCVCLCICVLHSVAFFSHLFTFALFVSAARKTVTLAPRREHRRLDVARTGHPYSWHLVQIYWTRPVPEAVVLSRRLQLNLKSRKIFLKLSASRRDIPS